MKNIITFVFATIFVAGMIPSAVFADTPLSVSCTPSAPYVDYGNTVTWTATVSGGTGPYTYQWSGDNSLSGSSDITTNTYSSAGDKNGHIVVADTLGAAAQADCSPMTVLAPLTFNSCGANEVNGMTGQTITWTSNISGGLPPYTFSWNGTNGLIGSGTQTTIVYSATGTKSAEIGTIADSLTHTITGTHSCTNPVSIYAQPSQMTASCSPSASTLSTGGSVTWNATVSGGTAPYNISWSGSDSFSATGVNATKTYASAGTKSAAISVTSPDGQFANVSCGSVNVTTPTTGGGGGPAIYTLVASCSANPSSTGTSSPVLWSTTVTGGTLPYSFLWTGSEGLSATTATTTKSYSVVGTASSSVKVTSNDNQTVTANCSVIVGSSNGSTGTTTTNSTGGSATSTSTTTGTTGGTNTGGTGTTIIPTVHAGTGVVVGGTVATGGTKATTSTTTATSTSTDNNGLVAGILAAGGDFFKKHPLLTGIIGLGILGWLAWFLLFAKRDEEEEKDAEVK